MLKPFLNFIILTLLILTCNSTDDKDRILLENNGNLYEVTTSPARKPKSVINYMVEYKGKDNFWPEKIPINPIIKKLTLSIHYQSNSVLRVKLTDATASRWEVPNSYPFPTFDSKPASNPEDSEFKVIVYDDPFEIVIKRKSTEESIWNSSGLNFFYSDLHIEFGTHVPTPNIFGFGERNYKFKMGPNGVYSIWAKDKPEVVEEGKAGGNVYGHHPVYLMKEKSNNWHTVFLRNSNAMDIIIERGETIRYKVAGGVIDLVFFLGDTKPETPIKMYHEYLGKWVMMPFWAMGYHQSRWGYGSFATLKHVVDKFREKEMPIDAIWSDLDYMIEKEDFTINSMAFPPTKLTEFMKTKKIHWVPIIDAGIARDRRKGPGYREGLKRDVFIKNIDDEPLTGTVWPGASHYVDFFHPNAADYWHEMLEYLYKKVPFSGIWLDMNEPTNFVAGELGKESKISRYDLLPYTPGGNPLKTMTISMDAMHHNGAELFNTHDLYGMMQSHVTYEYLKKKSPLPFVLTRSTAFGTGQFAAHWTGDNAATWEFLKFGTTGVFNFGIFGMPFTGADICGFIKSTTADLCARWYQIGALYPFARNHNHEAATDQEPWAFDRPDVEETARKALQLRYSLLKWYYAQFIEKNGTGLVFKPLFFEFPEETTLYEDDSKNYIDQLVMLGSSLLVAPVYTPAAKRVLVYFPKGTWFDLFTGAVIHNNKDHSAEKYIPSILGSYILTFLRGGKIIQTQDVNGVQWTKDLSTTYEFVVGFLQLDKERYAAEGFILGLGNYSSEEDVTSKCIQKDCVIDIKAYGIKADGIVQIHLVFKARSAEWEHLDEFEISSLKFYGLKEMIYSLRKETLQAVVSSTRWQEREVFSAAMVEITNDGDSLVLKNMSQKAGNGYIIKIELE